ncbi:MAG TPA: SDR family oxidoreductase [Polyangiaceae bacterium]|jgi:NAD(P)-dependent dehydrogenase (short-subunit alcohol dehydrogenase family)
MKNLSHASAVVIGGSSGVGRATVLALSSVVRRVFAVGRDRSKLEQVRSEASGQVELRDFDATSRPAIDALLREAEPELVVLAAGVRPLLAPASEQSWESFCEPWNQDVKMAFELGQAAIAQPLRPGSTVIFISSGAGLGGSPLSGGYAGAKRMQMFLASYLQKVSDKKELGIRFVALVPKQLIAGTVTGDVASRAYAEMAGISQDAFMQRFGAPLSPEAVAAALLAIARGEAGEGAPILGVTGKGLETL